jgi:hypothetical protein
VTDTVTGGDAPPCANSECGDAVPANRASPFCSKRCYQRHRYVTRNGAETGYAEHIARRYGLTTEEYRQRVTAQQGRCAVCGDEPENGGRLHVDHDHGSGAVRDLLCRPCNQALGLTRDDPSRLRALAEYLERHSR